MEHTFEALGLRAALVTALAEQGITAPTEIQQKMIPEILSGKDVIGRSETGSGKTLAYLLPIFEKLDLSIRGTQAIILTPTHELAAQVYHQAELLQENAGIAAGCVLLIGAAGIGRQLEKLKAKPRIVVGSVGRILDLIRKKKIQAHLVRTIVLDEGDRLMDDGNVEDVAAVIKTTLKERQIVLLSASVSGEAKAKAAAMMKADAVDLEAKSGGIVPKGIHHYYILSAHREKFANLRKILAGEKPEKCMVFLNNPENIEVTVDKLNYHGIKAAGIYGQASKQERKNAMDGFREGEFMSSLPPISALAVWISRALRISSIWMFQRSPRIISIVQAAVAERAWKALPSPLSPPMNASGFTATKKHGVCNLSRRKWPSASWSIAKKQKKTSSSPSKRKSLSLRING